MVSVLPLLLDEILELRLPDADGDGVLCIEPSAFLNGR